MDFGNKSKEEILAYLNKLPKEELVVLLMNFKEKRAFTYEDQMKLRIIDASPFTIWTSDRNCIIKYWGETCERLYGYKKTAVEGRDYIPLFVDEDEAPKARLDQIEIINNGKSYHNIANDITNDGRILTLITNCFRIYDINTEEPLNAEMGMTFDYLEEEKVKLQKVVSEHRMVKACIEQFIESTNQSKEQFNDRIKSLLSDMRDSARQVIGAGKITRTQFDELKAPIVRSLNDLQVQLDEIIDIFLSKMQGCLLSKECESIRIEFKRQYDKIDDRYENIILDFYELNNSLSVDSKITHIKEAMYKEISTRNSTLIEAAYELKGRIETDIEEYRAIGNVSATSPVLLSFQALKEKAQILHTQIDPVVDDFRRAIGSGDTETQLNNLLQQARSQFDKFDKQIHEIDTEREKVVT